MYLDMIYLDKRGDDDHNPHTWVYYRITPITGLGVPAGDEGSSVQTCRVTWPALTDIAPVCDAPGTVGMNSAYPNVNKVLEQWGVDRERSTLIGLRERH
jgi:hypothetical protein